MIIKPKINEIQRLVGDITEEQLRFIDSYIYKDIGIFLPVAGPCFYALTPEHIHPAYMVIYSFKENDKAVLIGEKIEPAKPGYLLFMSPGIKHQELPSDDIPKYVAIMIRPEFIEPVFNEYKLKKEDYLNNIVTVKSNDQLLPLCRQFIAENNKAHESLMLAISLQICHAIVRSTFNILINHQPVEWRFEIGKVIEFLQSNLHEKITLDEMAKIANMSIANFSRTFKKEMNQTAIEYLTELRLYKAQKMLLSNEFTMQDITSLCGFGSVSYLSTSFKKKYNISPDKYRQMMHGDSLI